MHQKYSSLNIQLDSDGPSLLLPAIVIFCPALTFDEPSWGKKETKKKWDAVLCMLYSFGIVRRSVKFYEEFLDGSVDIWIQSSCVAVWA